jgi:hypothetical protein
MEASMTEKKQIEVTAAIMLIENIHKSWAIRLHESTPAGGEPTYEDAERLVAEMIGHIEAQHH